MNRLQCVALIASLAAGSSSATAQERRLQSKVPVTIIVTQSAPLPRFGNLREFISTLLELQLAQDGFSRVSRAQEEPPCTVAPSARAVRDPAGNESRWYTIEIALQNAPAAADVKLDYRVVRFLKCERSDLFHSSDSFPESAALGNLTLAVEILALMLQDDVAELPVIELTMKVRGSTVNENPTARELAARILRSLVSSGEVDARLAGGADNGAANYYIDGDLDVGPSATTARFTIRQPSDDSMQPPALIPLPAIEGRRGDEAAFIERAANSVVSVIDDLRYSRAAGLTTRLTELPPEELRNRAAELLCVPAPQRGCVAQPREAEPVLVRLAEQTKTSEAYEWLGLAQAGSGKYVSAAESFRSALAGTNDAGVRARVTPLLADALYEGKQYDEAASQYEAAFAPGRGSRTMDPEVYVRWARSLRLGKGGAVRAAEVLIAGLGNPDVTALPLQTEFREVVSGAPGTVLSAIHQRLKSATTAGTAPLVYVVLGALARAFLSDAEAAHARADYAAMDASLAQAQALAGDLAADTAAREAMDRLRGLWHRDRPTNNFLENYTQAESFLKQALTWDPSSARAQFALGTTYVYWPAWAPDATNRVRQGAALLERLTLEHFPTAAEYLMIANRKLAQNEQTRAILQKAIASDPMDRSALDAMMAVCTDDLFAFDCAASAAEQLDTLEGSSRDMTSQLEIAEIELLAGRRAPASGRLDQVLANNTTGDRLRSVALFYRIWLIYLENARADTSKLMQDWRATVKKARGPGAVIWVFGGARHVLTTKPPFNARQVETLRGMIKEMEE